MGQRADDIDRLDADDETDVTTVEVTRAQIEQTRSEMSDTIDAIKEKLNTQTLAQQAKETVSEVTEDALQKARDAVHHVTADVAQQAKETVHQVVREARENLPATAAGVAHQAVSGAVSEAKEAVSSAVHTAKEAVSGAVDTARDTGSTVWDTVRENPIPAALIGIGLGWLFMRTRQQDRATLRYEGRPHPYAYPQGSETSREGGTATVQYRYAPGDENRGPSGASVGESLRQAQSRAGEVAARVPEKVGEVAGRVQEKVGEVAGRVQEKVGTVAAQVQEKVGGVAGQVQEKASLLRGQASEQARRVTYGFQQTLHDNPLAIGAVALGLGAAIGLMLPETRRENEMLGPARDQLLEKAQQTAHDLAEKVQVVAEETLDTAKQEARNQGLAPQ